MPPGTILITGATGKIGRDLVAKLINDGHSVRAIVRPSSPNAKYLQKETEIFHHDMATGPIPNEAFAGVTKVVHLAALIKDGTKKERFAVNVSATKWLLEECQNKRIERIVHASTILVYERKTNGTPITENCPIVAKGGIYEVTKAMAERIVTGFTDLPTTILRIGTTYGIGIRGGYYAIFNALERGAMWIFGRGKNRFSFVNVNDVVDAICLALEKNVKNGSVYNIMGPEALNLNQILEISAKELGVAMPKRHIPFAIAWLFGQIIHHLKIRSLAHYSSTFFSWDVEYPIDKARNELGFDPKIHLDKGIKKLVAFYQEEKGK